MSGSSRRLRSPEPPRPVRIAWAVTFWVAVVMAGFGLWLILVVDEPVRGAALLAVCLSALALYVSLRTWWMVQGLVDAWATQEEQR